MSFFSAPAKTKRVLVFHIGSSSIIAAHVLLEPQAGGSIPQIENSVTVSMPIAKELDSATLVAAMRSALKKSAELMVAENIGSPDEIVCFLESPWYATQVRTVRITKNTPFVVTEKLIKDLVSKETDLFQKEELSQYGQSENDSLIVERELEAIRLNGYPSSEPYGKKVREIDLSIVISFGPRVLMKAIQAEVASIFHRTDIRFQTFAYAGSSIVQDLFISHDQFLFADVGGEMTDIVLVKDNTYREAISFPWGTRTLLRSLSTKLGLPIGDAEALMSLYASGKLESSRVAKLNRALGPIMSDWTRNFEKTLEKLATKFSIPSTIALIIEPTMLSVFREAVLDESFIQHVLAAEPFAVVPLGEVPWKTYTRHTVPAHPRTSIASLLLAKQTRNK